VVYEILNDKKWGYYFKERASIKVGGMLGELKAGED